MPTNATPAFGTLLKMGDGGTPETFTTVAEVMDMAIPEINLTTEETTSHDSGGWIEKTGTLLSGVDPTFTINYLPGNATHNEVTGLLYVILNRVKRNWKLVLPNTAKTFSFAALVVNFKPRQPVKGILQADIKLDISGVVTAA